MINFLEVERTVKQLKQQVNQGKIDEHAFEEQLLTLIDEGEDGYYWMFGHETGRWYRHDGEQWVAHDPGEMFAPLEQVLAQDSLETRWRAFNTGWFILALVLLAIIAVLVFYSAA